VYFVFMYENGIMKPVEIVLRRGTEDEENDKN
jgi:predicted DNA-binding antitoxin AbrB/MazE fold protein